MSLGGLTSNAHPPLSEHEVSNERSVTTVPGSRIFIRLPPAVARWRAIQWASGLTFLSADSIAPVALWNSPTVY
jgi:hypothetical protein